MFNSHLSWLWPGILVALLIDIIITTILSSLWHHAYIYPYRLLLTDWYVWYVVFFTFIQAILSALLATILATVLARALYRYRFPGYTLLLNFLDIILALPVIVGVFGIISVFGQKGWLAYFCHILHISYNFSPYGLCGILLAHVFFNLPLATRLLLQILENIPIEKRQLAAQLNMSTSVFFFLVEWPYLRHQFLSAITLIFMLCFVSFTTVLALGGGPQTVTIEVAIYQALSYDFDVGRAAILALLQILLCFVLIIFSQRLIIILPIETSHYIYRYNERLSFSNKLINGLIILVALLFLLPPLLAVVINGININLLQVLSQTALWHALFTSLEIAIIASLLCLFLTITLLWSSRELRFRRFLFSAQLLNISGMVILIIPSIVLATGFFLLAIDNNWLPISLTPFVIIINTLMAIPYAYKILENPMQDIYRCYQHLCLSLNITGLNRLRLVEWRALRQPIGQVMSFASILSLGDFGVVALFGDEDFCTLPSYLYQQIGSYHSQDSSVTALLLLLLCLLLFIFFEKNKIL